MSADLESDWNLIRSVVDRFNDKERGAAITAMLDHLGDRFVTCPSRDTTAWTTARAGGLMDHGLRTFRIAREVIAMLEYDVSSDSVAVVSLFHEIGKVGDPDGEPYYVPAQWSRDGSLLWTWNPELPRMTWSHRSLCTLQRFGVKLTTDEWLAIMLAGATQDESRFYAGYEVPLASLLQQSTRLANLQERKL